MKKLSYTPIAAVLLVACGWAQAQSSVQVYGLMDLSVGSTQAPGGAANKEVASGKMTTSYLGFKGTEDLGNGLKAFYTLEHFLRANTGAAGRFDADTFWARNAHVGLSGNFGSLSLGRNTTSLFVQTLRFNAFGDSFGFSPSVRHYFTSGTTTGDTGWSDSLAYTSPRLGPVTVSVTRALGDSTSAGNTALALSYGAGPLAAGLAWQKVEKGAAVQNTTSWQAAGSYDFNAAKVFAQLGKVNNDSTGVGYDITGVGAAVPMGPAGKLLMQWGHISPDTGAKRSTVSLGYDHNLSKRTDVYAVYMSDKLSGQSAGNNYGVGIRHRF